MTATEATEATVRSATTAVTQAEARRRQVGYMFRADKTPSRRNLNQIGRMGLVCSRFRVATYQLSHAGVFG